METLVAMAHGGVKQDLTRSYDSGVQCQSGLCNLKNKTTELDNYGLCTYVGCIPLQKNWSSQSMQGQSIETLL